MKWTLVAVMISASAAGTLARAAEGDFRLYDGFDGKLALDWQPVRPDASHVSLTKHAGKFTITTQLGGIFGNELADPLLKGIQARNIYLIRNPAKEGDAFVLTACLDSFKPTTPYQQAGIIVYDDDDNYAKFGVEYSGRTPSGLAYTFVSETDQRDQIRQTEAKLESKQHWLRMTKRGNRYQYAYSTDGKQFTVVGETAWGHGRPSRVGILAKNGGEPDVGDVDAPFDSFEVRSLDTVDANDPRYVERQKIQGDWQVVSLKVSGVPLENPSIARFTFTDDRVIVTEKTRTMASEFTLQPSATPKQMVISEFGGGLRGSLRAVYSLDGDDLVICFHPDGGAATPAKLSTEKDDGRWLVTLRRQTGDAK